jgi:hypothetical protein
MSVLTIGDLEFEVRTSSRRRTLQVTVDRGGELLLFVPSNCDPRRIEEFVQTRRFWIYGKLAQKESVRPATPEKEYVSGEGFPYLGRIYRLLLVDEQRVPVKLEEGRFKMLRSAAPDGLSHMMAWYSEHARPWLKERVDRFANRVALEPSDVAVRDLGYRWGSCGKDRRLYFHWRSVLLPPRVVEYIVVHELVHLNEPHHTRAFWNRVERAMPDFAVRKQWLAENGAEAITL